jgi:hypothetical protein
MWERRLAFVTALWRQQSQAFPTGHAELLRKSGASYNMLGASVMPDETRKPARPGVAYDLKITRAQHSLALPQLHHDQTSHCLLATPHANTHGCYANASAHFANMMRRTSWLTACCSAPYGSCYPAQVHCMLAMPLWHRGMPMIGFVVAVPQSCAAANWPCTRCTQHHPM